MNKTLIAAAVLAAALVGGAQAATVSVPVHYRVNFVDPLLTPQLGLNAGSLFGGSASYDDADTPVDGVYTATSFSLNFGNYSFSAADDNSGFGVGIGPVAGGLAQLYFSTVFSISGGAGNGSYLLSFAGTEGQLTPAGNTSDFKLSASAVPVPASLPLLATGLGVMGWLARRRSAR